MRRERIGKGDGLYLQVVGDSRSWLLRYHFDGRERFMGLGSARVFGVKEARKRANRAKVKVADGIDPVAEKRAAKAQRALDAARSITFEEAARKYYEQHKDRWTNDKVRAQFMASMKTYAFPKIGKMSVADIGTDDVIRVLDPIWNSKPETAGRVRRRIEWVLGWATVRGYRTGDNPAIWRGHLATHFPSHKQVARQKNYKALRFEDLPSFWTKLAPRTGGAAAALRFAILTAARGGEVREATWDQVDFDAKTWTVPAAKMKEGREHVVPLSDAALAILEEQPRVGDFVFVGPSGRLSENALMGVLKRMKVDVTAHGFRSTFRDWAGDNTSFATEVIEFALAHHIPDRAAAAYRRYRALDKRRRLMNAWSKYATTPTVKADVVPLRRAG